MTISKEWEAYDDMQRMKSIWWYAKNKKHMIICKEWKAYDDMQRMKSIWWFAKNEKNMMICKEWKAYDYMQEWQENKLMRKGPKLIYLLVAPIISKLTFLVIFSNIVPCLPPPPTQETDRCPQGRNLKKPISDCHLFEMRRLMLFLAWQSRSSKRNLSELFQNYCPFCMQISCKFGFTLLNL